jgi:DnaK suppressor protein
LAERDRALDALQRSTVESQNEIDDSTRDTGDLASTSHDREVLYRLVELERQHLREIDAVLSRIERDEYGFCLECGDEIGSVRLEAMPAARLCLKCQEQVDSRRPPLHSTIVAHQEDEESNNAA